MRDHRRGHEARSRTRAIGLALHVHGSAHRTDQARSPWHFRWLGVPSSRRVRIQAEMPDEHKQEPSPTPTRPQDAQKVVRDGPLAVLLRSRDDLIRERIIRPLVSPAIIQEHVEMVDGRPRSADLQILLEYLGRHPDPNAPRYVIVRDTTDQSYVIARHSRQRYARLCMLGDQRYPSVGQAQHQAFLYQLADYGLFDTASIDGPGK